MRKLSKFGGPYLPHHWSDWPKIVDLVLWVPKQHVYQVSLKSETVGFNSLGDLTQNDPDDDGDYDDDDGESTFGVTVMVVIRPHQWMLLFNICTGVSVVTRS